MTLNGGIITERAQRAALARVQLGRHSKNGGRRVDGFGAGTGPGAAQRGVARRAALIAHGLLEDAAPPAFDDLARLAATVTRTAGAQIWLGTGEARTALGREGDGRPGRVAVVERAPVHGSDGIVLGAIEVLDVPDRELDPDEVALLELVARQAEALVADADEWFGAIGMALVDSSGKLIAANAALERMLGWSADEAVGADVLSYLHPEDLPGALESFTRTAAFVGPKIPYDLRFRTNEGTWRMLETVADNRLDDPVVDAIVFRLRDALDRLPEPATLVDQARVLKMIERAAPLDAVLAAVAQMLAVRDARTWATVRAVDGAGALVIGPSATVPPSWVASLGREPSALGAVTMARQQAVLVGDVAESPLTAPDAKVLTALGVHAAWSHPVVVGGEVVGSVDVASIAAGVPATDAAQRLGLAASLAAFAIGQDRLRREREHRALHDALTGLPNRTALAARLDERLATLGHAAATVVLIDLDRFQLVNDSLGHQAGDELLREVGRRLALACPSGLVARLAADAFAAVLEPDPDERDPAAVANTLLDALAAPFEVAGHRLYVTACAGVATSPCGAGHDPSVPDAGTLLQRADAALHHAKARHAGRSVAQVFTPDLGDPAHRSFVTESALREALRDDQLDVHFQPVVALDSGEVVAVEAFVRWTQPGVGPVRPDQFIPLAEHTGLIDDIDLAVLRQTCEQLARWNEVRLQRGRAPIVGWVNVAPEHLLREGFVEAFTAILAAEDVPPSWVGIEITERSRLSYDQNSLGTLAQLRAGGIALAIDDFGTGHASIGYLDQLPASVLKVDQSFTRKLDDPRTHATVRCILDLARTFEMTVVAEGVETAEQLAQLVELGCHHAQGFHLAMPAPAEDLDDLLLPPPA